MQTGRERRDSALLETHRLSAAEHSSKAALRSSADIGEIHCAIQSAVGLRENRCAKSIGRAAAGSSAIRAKADGSEIAGILFDQRRKGESAVGAGKSESGCAATAAAQMITHCHSESALSGVTGEWNSRTTIAVLQANRRGRWGTLKCAIGRARK